MLKNYSKKNKLRLDKKIFNWKCITNSYKFKIEKK